MTLQEKDLKVVRKIESMYKFHYIEPIHYTQITKVKHGIVDGVDRFVSLAQVKVLIKISNIIKKYNDSTRKRFKKYRR